LAWVRVPVELEVVNTPRQENFVFDKEGSDMSDDHVNVHVPLSQQEQAKHWHGRVTLDLATAQRGKTESLDVAILDENQAVDVECSPSHIEVLPALSPAAQRRMVLVQPVFVDEPDPGYEVWKYQVIPSQVAIIGPSEALVGISTLNTMPISLSGLTDTTTVAVKLKLPRDVRMERQNGVKVLINIRSAPKPATPTPSPGVTKPAPDPQNPQPTVP
jgi:YbbR domain-containing protein